jgi:hypothetical protein
MSSGSPKRTRSSRDRDSPDLYDLQYQVHDADFHEPLRKKQCRTNRMKHEAKIRDSALRELQARRGSKQIQKTTEAQKELEILELTSETAKSQKKKPRRNLPVDELVMVSERLSDFSYLEANNCE